MRKTKHWEAKASEWWYFDGERPIFVLAHTYPNNHFWAVWDGEDHHLENLEDYMIDEEDINMENLDEVKRFLEKMFQDEREY